MATFNSSRESRESGNFRHLVFTRSLKLEIRWASVRVGLEQSGAKISLVALSPEHISVQFQSSSRSRKGVANDSGVRNCCSLRFGSTADFTLAVLALGICSRVAVALCRDVHRVVGWRRSGIPSHRPFCSRLLLQLPAPTSLIHGNTQRD